MTKNNTEKKQVINIVEYTYVMNEFRGTLEVKDKDYKKFIKDKITLKELIRKYGVDYDDTPTVDNDVFFTESIEVDPYR